MHRAYTTWTGHRGWLAGCLLLLAAGAAGADELAFGASPQESSDGSVHLTWSLPEGATVHVQRAGQPDFSKPSPVYRGVDGASVITGLTDGVYFFRARSEYPDGRAAAWSEPLRVEVRHHPLARAFVFFLLGAVVFLATLWLIIGGVRGKEAEA